MRAERFLVECDQPRHECVAYGRRERGCVVRTRAHAEPRDARRSGLRKTASVVEFDIERGMSVRCAADGRDHRVETIVGCAAEEREREVNELRLDAAESGEVGERGERGRRDVTR